MTTTSTDAARLAALEDLCGLLDEQEADLRTLVELLQKEREHVAAFDVPALLETVQTKAAHLARWDQERSLRRNRCIDVWIRMGRRQRDLPGRLPDALRALSDDARDLDVDLELRASAFQVLFDVVAELQQVNKVAVQRALSWLQGALDSNDADRRPTTYSANGRRPAAITAALRRVV